MSTEKLVKAINLYLPIIVEDAEGPGTGYAPIPTWAPIVALKGPTNPEAFKRPQDVWIPVGPDAELLDAIALVDALGGTPGSTILGTVLSIAKPRPRDVMYPERFHLTTGTGDAGAIYGTTPAQKTPVVTFPRTTTPGVTQGFTARLDTPVGITTASFKLIWWGTTAIVGGGADDVRWTLTLFQMPAAGGQVEAAGTTISSVTATNAGAGIRVDTQVGAAVDVTPNASYRLVVQRLGANGADTYVAPADLAQIEVTYA